MVTRFVHGDLTKRVMGAAFEVHNGLGTGFLESIYEEALAYELRVLGINFQRQFNVPIYYKGRIVGEHRLDLLVEEQVVVELKAIKDLADIHTSILLSYLAATRLPVALLLNFGKSSLQYKRLVR